ncbi:MAG: hypothetical protein ABI977_34275 [Acidobacteriota bacterium]
MKNEIRYKSDLRVLSQQTQQQIEQDIKRLSESLTAGLPARLRLGDDQEIALPVAAVELIREALTLERDGKGFLLLEEDAEVSLEKAALRQMRDDADEMGIYE